MTQLTALDIDGRTPNAIYLTVVAVSVPDKPDTGEVVEGVGLWQSEIALCLN